MVSQVGLVWASMVVGSEHGHPHENQAEAVLSLTPKAQSIVSIMATDGPGPRGRKKDVASQ